MNGRKHERTLITTKSLTETIVKSKKYLFLILIIAFLLRIGMLNHVYFNDEIHPGRLIATQDSSKIFFSHDSGHPPFTTWVYWFFSFLFGNNEIVLRLVSVLFSLASIFLVYCLGRKEFGEKTGLAAAFFMSVSAWFVMGSTQIHLDAPFLTFFYTAIIYVTLLYDEQKKPVLLALLALLVFLALLTKETSVLIVLVAYCFLYCRQKKFHSVTYTKPTIAFACAGLLFFLFLIFTTVTTTGTDINTTNMYQLLDVYLVGKTTQEDIPLYLYLFPYVLALVFATPLAFVLLGAAVRKWKHTYKPYLLWIILIIFFYALSIKSASASFERWYIVTLPALCIIGADALAQYEWKRKDYILFVVGSIAFFLLSIFLNILSSQNIPFHPKVGYIATFLSGNWNVLLPLLGNAGPLGFYLSAPFILGGFVFTGILLIFFFIAKKENTQHLLLIILLAVALGMNLFVIEESSYGLLHGDVDQVTKELLLYERGDIFTEPVFIFRNYALNGYYLFGKYQDIRILDFPVQEDQSKIEEIQKTHGTVLLVDFPKIDKNSSFWKIIETCEKKKEIRNKEVRGYVFDC